VSEAVLAGLDPERVAEISLVDLAFLILKTTDKPYHYRDLMLQVATMKGMTEEQINDVIARLYTEINIDGRFVCIGSNVWGLKRWYPTDKTADKTAGGGKKFVRKDMDDDDFFDDDDDATFEDEIDEDEPFAAYGDDDAVEEEEELDGFTEEGEDAEEALDEDDALDNDNEEDEFESYEEEDEDF